jgi:hypothetical protein
METTMTRFTTIRFATFAFATAAVVSVLAPVQSAEARGGPSVTVRDHRAPAPSPVVRDHRTSGPVVRDHRSPVPAPIVRDHRTSKPSNDVSNSSGGVKVTSGASRPCRAQVCATEASIRRGQQRGAR